MIVCFHQLLHCQLILPCLAQCNAMQWVWLPTVANSLSSQGSTTVTVCWPVLHSTSLIVSRLSWTLPHDSSMVLASLTEYSIWSATVSIGYQSTRGCSLSCVYWLIKLCTAQLHTTSLTCASRCPPLTPDGDPDPQHTRTSSSLGPPRSSELAHSPSLSRLSGTDCRYIFAPSRWLTVLKSHWSLSSSPLLTDMCRDTVRFLCDRSSPIALMRDLVMTLSCYGAFCLYYYYYIVLSCLTGATKHCIEYIVQ